MHPDLLIIGDSHTAALHEAALARGLKPGLLYISGNFWHENQMRPNRAHGLTQPHRRGLNRRIIDFTEQTGGPAFRKDVPVLASIGYHLGRLVPLFSRHGHTPDAAQFGQDDAHLFVSDDFLMSYILHHRDTLFRVLRYGAQNAKLTVVAPPMIQTDPVALYIGRRITSALRKHGLTVFDPRDEEDWADRPLPEHLRAQDGVHGNAAYGAEVLDRLSHRGLLTVDPATA